MSDETREAALGMLMQPEPEQPADNGATDNVAPAKTPNAGQEPAASGKDPAPEKSADKGAEKTADPKAVEPAAAAAPDAQAQEAALKAFVGTLGERCSSVEQMKAQLADAHALYDICYGRAEPTGLLEMLKTMYPEAYAKVGAHFAAEGGRGAAPEAAKTADPANPLEKKITDLEAWKNGQEKQREAQATREKQMKIVDGFGHKVAELAKKAGLDEDEVGEYMDAISARIGRDRAMLERLEAGKFTDVERLFNERHTRENERFKKRSDGLIKNKQDRDRTIPKSPAGGAPPAPAAGTKANLADRESRTAAALAEFTA